MNPFRQARWSPYVVGALLGVLSWFAFVSVDKPLGTSTTFVRAVGFVEEAIAPEHVAQNAYFAETKRKVDWQMMLVVGMGLGALVSAWLAGDFNVERVPELWRRRFGSSIALRYAAAFGSGALLMFGARLADGCTSGHGLSGSLQLAVSGWLFLVVLFVTGVLTALAVYGKERQHV